MLRSLDHLIRLVLVSGTAVVLVCGIIIVLGTPQSAQAWISAPPADRAALLQPHDNSAARNEELRVTRTDSAPLAVRSATLLCAAFSAVRLAHRQGFRGWMTRLFRS
jgi:hypothetical protein